MAIDWDTIYKQKWQELSGGYKKREDALNAAKISELNQLNSILSQNKGELESRRDDSMREAYISQMNAYRELPETLKKSGLGGGVTESAASDILRNYQNSRNSANSIFSDGVSRLNAEFGKNKSSIDARYLNLFNELEDAKNKDVWEQTKFAYNAALEEQKRLEERQKARNAQIAERQKARQAQIAAQAAAVEEKRRWEAEQTQAQAAAIEEKRRWEAAQAASQAKQDELIRQFNEQMAFKQQQAEWDRQQTEWERQQAELDRARAAAEAAAAAAAKSSGGSSRSKSSGGKKSGSKKTGAQSQNTKNTNSLIMNKYKKDLKKNLVKM